MRFLCVKQPARANIFGQDFDLRPLDPRRENIEDILVADNTSASELLERHPDILLEVSIDASRCKGFPRMVNRLDEIEPGGKVLIMRNGGIGDHLMLLPALRYYRELFPPGAQIWVATQKEKHPLFFNNPNLDRLFPLPLTFNQLMQADFLVDFSSRQDWYDLASLPMTDSYLNFLHIEYENAPDKCPRILWSRKDSPEIYEAFKKVRKENPGRPLVLLNWKASNRLRDIPPEKLLFLTRNHPEVLFVVAQSMDRSPETSALLQGLGAGILFDCSRYMRSLSDYIGAVENCDAVVSTDTSTSHIAEALGRPGLVLYGPTRHDLWIRYYRKALPVLADYSGKTCRSPCGLTKDTKEGCPEAVLLGSFYSPCLLSISEERIQSAFRELLHRLSDTRESVISTAGRNLLFSSF